MAMYVELRYCPDHVCEHWQEVDRNGKVRCRGEDVSPTDTEKTFAKRKGHGYNIYKVRKLGMPVTKEVERDTHISQLQVDF